MKHTRRTITVTATIAKTLRDSFGSTPGFQDMFSPAYTDDLGVEWCVASGVFTDAQLAIIDKALAKADVDAQVKLGAVKTHTGDDYREKMDAWKLKAKSTTV